MRSKKGKQDFLNIFFKMLMRATIGDMLLIINKESQGETLSYFSELS